MGENSKYITLTENTFQNEVLKSAEPVLVDFWVTNWTHSDRRRRMEFPVGVAYGSDVQKVMSLLQDVAQSDEDLLKEPEPVVLFIGFGDSSLDFELRAWTGDFDSFLAARSRVCVAIEAALKSAGIEIPLPQRDLHVRGLASLGNGPPRQEPEDGSDSR